MTTTKTLEQRRKENDLKQEIKDRKIKEKEIWLQFAVAFSVNNSNGITYTIDNSMNNRTGKSTIDNRIARRADEMLRQYKERFDK